VKALVFDGTLGVRRDHLTPVPPAGEALVRVRLAGICNTDLEIVRGYMAFRGILGHEFVGEVADGADSALIGRRVVGEINAYCGECDTCRAGRPTHCPHRTVLGILRRDGAFAEYLTLPTRNLHLVPDGIPDDVAIFVEPLAAAFEILAQVHVRPTDRVIVVGDGKLAQLVARVLRLTGCTLTVVGKHPEKLALLSPLGITTHELGDPIEGQADIVVECTGHPEGFAVARALLRPRGTFVAKSTYHSDLTLNWSRLVVDEITVVGSRCGPFDAALRTLANGLVDVKPLVHAVYPLDEGPVAFAHAARPETLKVVLRM